MPPSPAFDDPDGGTNLETVAVLEWLASLLNLMNARLVDRSGRLHAKLTQRPSWNTQPRTKECKRRKKKRKVENDPAFESFENFALFYVTIELTISRLVSCLIAYAV